MYRGKEKRKKEEKCGLGAYQHTLAKVASVHTSSQSHKLTFTQTHNMCTYIYIDIIHISIYLYR